MLSKDPLFTDSSLHDVVFIVGMPIIKFKLSVFLLKRSEIL